MGTIFARQGDIRREGAPPATSEDLGGHSEQFAASEFFNVEVVEEFFKVKVVELFVEAEQSVVSEFFNIEVESEFFNIEVVTNVEWSSSISRWWTSSSTSRRGSSGSSRRGSCRRE